MLLQVLTQLQLQLSIKAMIVEQPMKKPSPRVCHHVSGIKVNMCNNRKKLATPSFMKLDRFRFMIVLEIYGHSK